MSLQKIVRKNKIQKVREVVSAKPTLGKSLKKVKFTFYYLDGSAIELDGETSDISGLFVGPKSQRFFKKQIFKQAEQMGYKESDYADAPVADTSTAKESLPDEDAQSETDPSKNADFTPNSELPAIVLALKELNTYDFAKATRVLLLEEAINRQKHLILQICRLRILTEYAHNLDSSQWSFARGMKYDYLVNGSASSLPHEKKLWHIGNVFIHIFIPDDRATNETAATTYLEKAVNLAEIVPMMPQVGSLDEVLKAKDDELGSKDGALKKIREDYSEKATLNEAAKTAIAGLEGDGEIPKTEHKSLGAFTFLAVIGLGVVVSAFASTLTQSPLAWPVGFVFGNLLGFGVVEWRK